MTRLVTVLVAVLLWNGVSGRAGAQPALERLEEQVRGLVERGGPGEAGGRPPAGREPGYLGVVADDRQDLGAGVRLVEVLAGGPAEKAGLKAGDLVTGIDGRPVRSMPDFTRLMAPAGVGGKLIFEVERDGQVHELEVTLVRRPPRGQRPFDNFGQIPQALPAPARDRRRSLLGVRTEPVTAELQARLDLPVAYGARVVGIVPESPAELAGLPVGAVIVVVDGARVEKPADLARRVAGAGAGREIKLAYYSDGLLHQTKIRLAGAVDAGPNLPEPQAPAAELLEPPLLDPPGDDRERIAALERRVRELEERLADMERVLGRALKEVQEPDDEGPQAQ